MNEQELHPIPADSLVTEEMVERWLAIYPGDNRITTIGTLLNFEQGRGELPAHVFDAVEHREIFAPLRDVYFRQKGMNPPPFSNVEGADVNEDAGSEAEGTEKTEETKADESNTGEGSASTEDVSTGEGSASGELKEGEANTRGATDESEASSAEA